MRIAGPCSSAVEYLPSKHKVPDSIPRGKEGDRQTDTERYLE